MRGAKEEEEGRTAGQTDRGKELAERTNVMVSNSGLLLLTTFFCRFICQQLSARRQMDGGEAHGRVNIASASGLLFFYAGWASALAGRCQVVTAASECLPFQEGIEEKEVKRGMAKETLGGRGSPGTMAI